MKLYELNIKHSSFQVLTQVLLKIQVFQDVALRCSMHSSKQWHSGGGDV